MSGCSGLHAFQARQLIAKMRPCVSQSELLQGTEDALRLRLAALLHFTGLQDQVPVDLRSRYVLSLQQPEDYHEGDKDCVNAS